MRSTPVVEMPDFTEKFTNDFDWEPITQVMAYNRILEDDLLCSYILHKSDSSKRPKLQVKFSKTIADHMGIKLGDKVGLLQSKTDAHNYLLCKQASGYKLQKYPHAEVYNFDFRFGREGLQLFKQQLCKYELYNNRTVRIILPKPTGSV